jgi:hypothetical protein
MKSQFFVLLITITTLISCAPSAVSVRPAAVVRVRPVAPSPRHIWVSDNYIYRHRAYRYRGGYWSVPRRGYHGYVDGYWRQNRRGYIWVPGYWR